jgi:hypothetical protein
MVRGKEKMGGLKNDTRKKNFIVAPLPRYIIPDESEPECLVILEKLHDFRKSVIGSSYYYGKAGMIITACSGLFMMGARGSSMK